LAEEQNTLESQRAQEGDGGRQRLGEAWQGWAETHDSPQLLVLAGDLHCPKASLSASSTFLSAVPAARPLPTQEQVAGASMLLSHKASQMHSDGHMQPTEASSSRSCTLAVRSVKDGWEKFFNAMGTGCFLLEAAACGTPFVSLLSQLLQAGMPRQPPPQLEPLGTAGLAPS